MRTILLIDDHAAIRETLTEVLTDAGHSIVAAENQTHALAKLAERDFDLVLTDLMLPDGSGMEILAQSQKNSPTTPVVMITGHGSISNAVEATRLGAFDYLTKPVDLNKLRVTVRNALRLGELEQKIERGAALDALVGQSPAVVAVKELVKQVAYSDVTVLIEGESGTGKELVANALQAQSPRAGKPFIKVNVAALSRELVESELFGHEKGAFSGAIRQRKGRFEMADGGTLFLDEIGEMPLDMQVKLLRVLQERELERVGSSETLPVDIRLLCATNRDLRQLVADGKFREDLFYRINVLPIKIPPLRERPGDIELLALHFLQKFNARYGLNKEWSKELLARLTACPWRGNVRELENTLEGTFVRATATPVGVKFLPPEIGGSGSGALKIDGDLPAGLTLDEVEKRYLLSELARAGGNKSKAAKSLNIGIKTLYRKLEAYGALDGEEEINN
ncbi:acetoacetate metabolism regulatory protein AtoC [Planctomycetales bacterium]|nr:acetoacetate metabolism regulatory protein AtoC [Planctomycetales bacterium]